MVRFGVVRFGVVQYCTLPYRYSALWSFFNYGTVPRTLYRTVSLFELYYLAGVSYAPATVAWYCSGVVWTRTGTTVPYYWALLQTLQNMDWEKFWTETYDSTTTTTLTSTDTHADTTTRRGGTGTLMLTYWLDSNYKFTS